MPTLTVEKFKADAAKTAALRKQFDLDASRARAVTQIERANGSARKAIDEAIAAGALLIEIREGLKLAAGPKWNDKTKDPELKFKVVLEEIAAQAGCSDRNLRNWIGAAENACAALAETIDLTTLGCPVSHLLTMPEAEIGIVGSDAVQARQLLFAWMSDKTIGEACRGVVIDGDDSSRITRAHKGKTTGGTHEGDNRKDYPKFFNRALVVAATHVEKKRFDTYTAIQKEKTFLAVNRFIEKLPAAVIEQFMAAAKEELKKR